MCALLLLLVGAAFARAQIHQLHPEGTEYHAAPYPPEYAPAPQLLPYQLSRDNPYERPVKTNRLSHADVKQAQDIKDIPKLRTNVSNQRDVEICKSKEPGTRAILKEPLRSREHDEEVFKNKNETALLKETETRSEREKSIRHNDSSDTTIHFKQEEQETPWVWGSSDASDAKNTTVGDLDDRTSIAGANCPTGQVKIEGKCVDKH